MNVDQIFNLLDRLSGAGSLTAFIFGVLATLCGVGWLIYKLRRHVEPLLREIRGQLIPNGGSSLHDKISAISRRTLVDNRLMQEVINHQGLLRWVSDKDGRCIWASEAYATLVGLAAVSLEGQGWKRTIHQEDRNKVLLEWTRSVKDGSAFFMKYRIVTPAGKSACVIADADAVRDESGVIVAYVGKITPIDKG